MNWFGWVLVGWWAANALLTVARVGKDSKPTDSVTAAVVVAIDAALIVALLTVGTGR